MDTQISGEVPKEGPAESDEVKWKRVAVYRTFRRSPRQFPRIFQRVGKRATPARRSAGPAPGGE